jgi:hypothetical protein
VDDISFSWIVRFCNLPPPYCAPHCPRAGEFQPFAVYRLLADQETDMTAVLNAILQKTIPGSPPAPVSGLLAPSEPRALIAILSTAKRNALLSCFNAGGLRKKSGAWHGPTDGKPVSGVTVADLARDGMLTLPMDHHLGSAQLTERGSWFARTLLQDAIAAK